MSNYSYPYPNKHVQMGFIRTMPENIGGKTSSLPDNPQPAMAYVPFQTDLNIYDEMKGLKAGTMFPCLDKPFLGSGAR